MKVYVMRHGPAEESAPSGRDDDRALTASGRDRVRDVAKALVAIGEEPLLILSSPLVRAVQTAEIVLAVTKLSTPLEIRRELSPGSDALPVATAMVRAGKKRVMIVGHEPDLSMLILRLIGEPPITGMQKAMVVSVTLSIENDELKAERRFILDPKSLIAS